MRELVDASKLSSDPTTFIQQLSSQHNVRVDVFDIPVFIQRGSALRIIGITQAFEVFLDRMIEAHPRLGNRDGRKNSETVLDFILRKLSLPQEVGTTFTNSVDYRLYSYYRTLRNAVAHQNNKSAGSNPGSSIKELQTATSADLRYGRFVAPNNAQGLTFDDYVLFSRAAKATAAELCRISGPSDAEIGEWLDIHRDRSGNLERQANNVRTLLRFHFALDDAHAESFVVNLRLTGQ